MNKSKKSAIIKIERLAVEAGRSADFYAYVKEKEKAILHLEEARQLVLAASYLKNLK